MADNKKKHFVTINLRAGESLVLEVNADALAKSSISIETIEQEQIITSPESEKPDSPPPPGGQDKSRRGDIYQCDIPDSDKKAYAYVTEHPKEPKKFCLMVLEGSYARKEGITSNIKEYTEALVKQGVLTHSKKTDLYVFTRDYWFDKPSPAASIVKGSSSSGYEKWKKEGADGMIPMKGTEDDQKLRGKYHPNNPVPSDHQQEEIYWLIPKTKHKAIGYEIWRDNKKRFVVKKNSYVRGELLPYVHGNKRTREWFEKLMDICTQEGNIYKLSKNIEFPSRHLAAKVTTGVNSVPWYPL